MMNKLTESEFEFIISRVLDNANEAVESDDKSQFADGKKLAYYEMLDTIRNELIVRDIDIEPFGFDTVLKKLL